MKELVIVGCGGLAKEVAFLVEEINRHTPTWILKGHVAGEPEAIGKKIGGHAVYGDDQWLETCSTPIAAALAIGTARILTALRERFSTNPRISFPNLVHPRVTGDWSGIRMGEGNLVLNGAAFTTGISTGSFNVFNPGCTVAHDCVLGSYNLLGPGAHVAGGVVLGDRVLLGVGAQVLPGVRICDDVIVGGGAAVIRSIDRPGTYVGVPAERLDREAGG